MRLPLIPLTATLKHAIDRGIVVTHTARQAYELKYSWMHKNVLDGVRAFPSPEIYSFDEWLQRVYEDLVRIGIPHAQRFLITHSSLRLAFQLCAPESDYVKHVAATTRAWRTYVEWNLQRVGPDLEVTENGRLFRTWVRKFQNFQKRQKIITLADLPALITLALNDSAWCPKEVTFFGLEEVSPARQELIYQLREHGCNVSEIQPPLLESKRHRTIKFETSSRERSTLVTWIRAQLSTLGSNRRIGVIVPDLATGAPRLRSQFEASFFDCYSVDRVVNIGLGFPLRDTRLCKDVVQFLDWTTRDLGYEEILQLGRSPFLRNLAIPDAFSDTYPERMYFREYVVREKDEATIPALRSILRLCSGKKQALHEWVNRVIAILETAGWSLYKDAETQRAQAAFMLLFSELTKLSPLLGSITWTRAVDLIRNELRAQTLTVDIRNTPVQVFSREEATGLVFDALWVTGTSEEQWPPKVDLNPMIPISVQRKARVPRVTQAQILNWAKKMSEDWARMAPNAVFSFVDEEKDNADFFLESSRLLAPHKKVEVATLLEHPEVAERDHPWGSQARESLLLQYSPERGTKLPEDTTWIRTSTIRDQSRCPFRAWAIHRLNLPDRISPHRLPNVLDRGTDVHELTEKLLKTAQNRAQIDQLGSEDIAEAVNQVLKKRRRRLPAGFIDRERERLTKLAHRWIEFEVSRDDFKVVALEKKFSTKIAGLDLSLRVDRIDTTEELSCLIIDYKTGTASPNSWLPPRLNEPQMPLYSVVVPDTDGLAYQKIPATGKITMTGFADTQDQRRKLKTVPDTLGTDFSDAKAKWKHVIEATVEQYKNGDARVDPINVKTVCQHCHLMGFCRQFTDITFELETPALDDVE
ncbi:MAG: hypothetical protein F4Z01_01505 [Gammaproteobacteria bacterium]|nr:hypothetical protein [Gammaproteobacteria bacterium]MYF38251.1 hypothetical protein [Gammaproteobacteria bacterium]